MHLFSDVRRRKMSLIFRFQPLHLIAYTMEPWAFIRRCLWETIHAFGLRFVSFHGLEFF